MRKNKLYIVLAVLSIIFLFSFAALCNKFSAPAEDKIDIGEEEAVDKASDDNADADSDTKTDSDSDDKTDSDTKTDSDSDDKTDSDAGGDGKDAKAEAPTVKLKIYEGPVYSAGDRVCYYRIRADVTGKPNPDIKFSKDDSGGAWGLKKVQINLKDPSNSYTLTVTATNSAGSASDSITLKWGCNSPPVIASIVVDQDFHYTDETYEVVVNKSDPDGDALTVAWSVSGGSINDVHANPMNWTTPSAGGDYDIIVEVDDGKGGTSVLTKSVEVLPALPPAIFNTDVPHIPAEGGYLVDTTNVYYGTSLYAGDYTNNKPCRGFISYDITGLAGVTITDASLTFTLNKEWGDPSFYDNLYINILYWGEIPIHQGLFSTSGTVIQGFSASGTGNFVSSAAKLREELQKAINEGKTRFQARIHFTGSLTDGDSDWDGWEYEQSQIILNVTGNY